MVSKMISGAEYILKKLHLLGVNHIFGIPGAHIDPFLIASASSNVDTIVNCHELSAGYMADGYSRVSGKIGVITGIGGPGSNNMVTAVNTARIEKVPLLAITGDVPVHLSDVPGFQTGNELGSNDDTIFKPITKYSKRVNHIEELGKTLDEALRQALTPPFGPVHLIVPYNVFKDKTNVKPSAIDLDQLKYHESNNSKTTVNRLKKLILSDKKIIFWIGDSLNKIKQSKQILELAEKFHIPVATSFSAKGVISEAHKLAIGNFGYAGSSKSKEIFLSDAPDAIIGFDIEQNERNSLNWNIDLYKGKDLLLINYPGSFAHKKYGESIADNPFYVLQVLHAELIDLPYNKSPRKQYFDKIIGNPHLVPPDIPVTQTGIVEPGRMIQILQQELPRETVLFVDSGTHRVFAGFYWRSPGPESYFSASIVAPLGWALAAAIGGKFAINKPVVVFSGDGCMQMHGIELKTAIKHNRPMLVIINNNKAFGSIYKRFSQISEKAAQMASITEINWNQFCESFGAEVFDVDSEESFKQRIQAFLKHQKLTVLNVNTPVKPYIHDVSLAKSAFA